MQSFKSNHRPTSFFLYFLVGVDDLLTFPFCVFIIWAKLFNGFSKWRLACDDFYFYTFSISFFNSFLMSLSFVPKFNFFSLAPTSPFIYPVSTVSSYYLTYFNPFIFGTYFSLCARFIFCVDFLFALVGRRFFSLSIDFYNFTSFLSFSSFFDFYSYFFFNFLTIGSVLLIMLKFGLIKLFIVNW